MNALRKVQFGEVARALSVPMNLHWRWTAPSPFPSAPQGGRGCRRRERRRLGGSKRESLRGILSPGERAGVRASVARSSKGIENLHSGLLEIPDIARGDREVMQEGGPINEEGHSKDGFLMSSCWRISAGRTICPLLDTVVVMPGKIPSYPAAANAGSVLITDHCSLNTDDPLTGPPAPRHQPLTTDYCLLITGHSTTDHPASGSNPRQFLERVKYPQLSLLGSSRLRGGSSSIDTGHCFQTSSQFGFRFSRRSRTMSSSASKLASNRSPGAAGASATGMLTRRLASSVTIMVGTSHIDRKLSILRRGDESWPPVAEYSATDHRLLITDYSSSTIWPSLTQSNGATNRETKQRQQTNETK